MRVPPLRTIRTRREPDIARSHEVADGRDDDVQQLVAPRSVDPHAIAAAYREGMLRQQRIHAALGIPWVVSDAERAHFGLLPGLPRMDAVGADERTAAVSMPVSDRETWTILEMTAWAHDALGFTHAEIAGALGVRAPTIRRWERGESAPRGRLRIQFDALQDLRALLETVFAMPEHAMRWLRRSPNIRDGVPPLAMIKSGAITPLVSILASVESGAFL